MSSGGSGSSGGSNTVTQVQQIPDWQQGFAQSNEQIASALASQPYPTYQGQLIAGFTPQQTQGMQMAGNAATSYQPTLQTAQNMTEGSATPNPLVGAGAGEVAGSAQTWNPQTAAQYMSPYASAALQPQVQALQLQQAAQNQQIASQATQAGAFGDARQGVAQGLNNFYGNLATNDLMNQGMNSAYQSGQQAFAQNQQQQLAAGSQLANMGEFQQQQGLAAGSQDANIANLQQQLGLSGASAVFGAGTQQQQLNQQQLALAYNNFQNQVNWPAQELNMRIAALSDSPYNTSSLTVSPPTNATAMNLGAFGALAGGLGSLLNGNSSSGSSSGSSGSIFGSDIIIKKNIQRIGSTPAGIPVYEFNYLWDDTPHVGVMAQEVETLIPEAVTINAHGIKLVNYDLVR